MRPLREAPFALRVVHRKGGRAAIIYRRRADANGRDRLQRVAAISPLAFTAASPLLRDAALAGLTLSQKQGEGTCPPSAVLNSGSFLPLDADWGPRVACFALLATGLRDAERLSRAAGHLHQSDPNEAAWWLAVITRNGSNRPLRAFRILTEAVE